MSVVVKLDFWPIPLLLTYLMAWIAGQRWSERSWSWRLGVGLLAMPIALFANVGHALAHTVSPRRAGVPMDEILLSSGKPRTLYENKATPTSRFRLLL